MTRKLTVLFSMLAIVGCGDSDTLKCADGTFASGHDCLDHDPNDKAAPITTATPAGGRTRAAVQDFVVLTSNEPARIFYTTDGSEPTPAGTGEPSPVTVTGITDGTTLKFFAIDAAGNRETTHTTTFTQDVTAPAPVTGLSVTTSGTTATVSWTNPSGGDYAGTVIARVLDLADTDPTPGKTYAAPAGLSAAVQIVYVGTGSQFVDPGQPTGVAHYAAWTFDDLHNYSAPVQAEAPIGTLATAGQITYNTGTSTLAISQIPPSLDLSASTATYDGAGQTLTLHLSVKNLTSLFFSSPKALVTSVTNATFTGSDGTADGSPFQYLGPNFLAPGATATKDLVFTGAAAATTVTIGFDLGRHPLLIGGAHPGCCSPIHRLLDVESGTEAQGVMAQTQIRNRQSSTLRPGVLVAGHYLDVPTSHSAIERWDLATYKFAARLTLTDGNRSNVSALFAIGTSEYAVMKSSGRRQNGTLRLLRLDNGLRITGSLDLGLPKGQGSFVPAVSADGTTLAIPGDGGIALVDVATLTQIDADTSTPAVDVLAVPNVGRVRSVSFFSGTTGLVAIGYQTLTTAIVKRAGTGYTVAYVNGAGGNRSNALARTPDGKVWIARDSQLTIYDPGTDLVTPSAYVGGARALQLMGGKLYVLRTNERTVDRVDATGLVEKTIAFSSAIKGHWMQGTAP